jgi:hypothetical protein
MSNIAAKEQKKKKASTIDEIEDAEEESKVIAAEKKKKEEAEEEDEEDPDDPVEHDSDYEEESDDEPDDVAEENLNSSDYFRVVKVVPPNMRVTSDVMTMAEYSDIIGIRTTQIEHGAPIYTDVGDILNTRDIAIKELFDRKCPLFIKRGLSKFLEEHWSCREMAFPADVRSGY